MGSEAAAMGELVVALEQAALMAKQFPSSATTAALDPSQVFQIYSSLQTAHHHLTLFLSHHPPPPFLLPFQPHQASFLPSLQPPPPPPPLENSFSSAVGGGDEYDMDPMQMGDDDEVEHDSKNTSTSAAAAAVIEIEGVEDRMRDCFIQNKRPKRPLSPSSVAAVAEQRPSYVSHVAAGRGGSSAEQFDPEGSRLRSLDLVYQFHG
ncbi:uncharacterized protein LOC113764007 [Coffea eugenioides]|uniref:uncharacterized protein LOC113764007 n=1 Tax=Coffea eugenioides TaxID=49369 RepID=UPI000F6126C2|nr:uncharacterized protein LOC113764007 [Coffea eugenioides]